jgi:hypothetical protein
VEVSDVRRRLRAAIDRARQAADERRTRTDAALRDYEAFLLERATPVFHQVAAALNAEGYGFKVFTPAGSIRLASDRSPDEAIEISLDTPSDPPSVVARTTRGRGRRMISSERVVGGAAPVADLTEEDVLALLLDEIVNLLGR